MVGCAQRCEPASVGPRDFVDAMHAHDFLDKIDISLQIAPVTWDFPCRSCILTLALAQFEALKNLIDDFRFDRQSENLIAFLVAQGNIRRICRNFSSGCNFFCGLSVRDFANQSGCALRCPQDHSWINTALEAIARIARQTQIPRGATNAGWEEISGFQQNISRRFRDSSFFATHHTANSDGALFIGDHEVLGRERIRFAIEREKPFSLARKPNIDPTFQFIGIKCVRWLTEFEHHKVGNIDDVVDRTDPNAFNLGAQPGWTWSDLHTVDLARRKEWTLTQRADFYP